MLRPKQRPVSEARTPPAAFDRHSFLATTATEQAEMQKQEAQAMQMHQKMMADMKAMGEKLNALVTEMNAATGEAKVNAIAEVVTAVVQQRAAMRGRLLKIRQTKIKP